MHEEKPTCKRPHQKPLPRHHILRKIHTNPVPHPTRLHTRHHPHTIHHPTLTPTKVHLPHIPRPRPRATTTTTTTTTIPQIHHNPVRPHLHHLPHQPRLLHPPARHDQPDTRPADRPKRRNKVLHGNHLPIRIQRINHHVKPGLWHPRPTQRYHLVHQRIRILRRPHSPPHPNWGRVAAIVQPVHHPVPVHAHHYPDVPQHAPRRHRRARRGSQIDQQVRRRGGGEIPGLDQISHVPLVFGSDEKVLGGGGRVWCVWGCVWGDSETNASETNASTPEDPSQRHAARKRPSRPNRPNRPSRPTPNPLYIRHLYIRRRCAEWFRFSTRRPCPFLGRKKAQPMGSPQSGGHRSRWVLSTEPLESVSSSPPGLANRRQTYPRRTQAHLDVLLRSSAFHFSSLRTAAPRGS